MIPPNLLAEAEAAADKFLEQFCIAPNTPNWLAGKRDFTEGVDWLFQRLCESEGEFDGAKAAEVFYQKMNCCPQDDRHSFEEGARHQHALSQAALLKARERVARTEAQNQRLRVDSKLAALVECRDLLDKERARAELFRNALKTIAYGGVLAQSGKTEDEFEAMEKLARQALSEGKK